MRPSLPVRAEPHGRVRRPSRAWAAAPPTLVAALTLILPLHPPPDQRQSPADNRQATSPRDTPYTRARHENPSRLCSASPRSKPASSAAISAATDDLQKNLTVTPLEHRDVVGPTTHACRTGRTPRTQRGSRRSGAAVKFDINPALVVGHLQGHRGDGLGDRAPVHATSIRAEGPTSAERTLTAFFAMTSARLRLPCGWPALLTS